MTIGEILSVLRRANGMRVSYPMAHHHVMHLQKTLLLIQQKTDGPGCKPRRNKPRRIKKGSEEWLAKRAAEKMSGWHPGLIKVIHNAKG